MKDGRAEVFAVARGALGGVGGAVALDGEQILLGPVGIADGEVDAVFGAAEIVFGLVAVFGEESGDLRGEAVSAGSRIVPVLDADAFFGVVEEEFELRRADRGRARDEDVLARHEFRPEQAEVLLHAAAQPVAGDRVADLGGHGKAHLQLAGFQVDEHHAVSRKGLAATVDIGILLVAAQGVAAAQTVYMNQSPRPRRRDGA